MIAHCGKFSTPHPMVVNMHKVQAKVKFTILHYRMYMGV